MNSIFNAVCEASAGRFSQMIIHTEVATEAQEGEKRE